MHGFVYHIHGFEMLQMCLFIHKRSPEIRRADSLHTHCTSEDVLVLELMVIYFPSRVIATSTVDLHVSEK